MEINSNILLSLKRAESIYLKYAFRCKDGQNFCVMADKISELWLITLANCLNIKLC